MRKSIVLAIVLAVLPGCSSSKYAQMPTLDERVNQYNQSIIKPGMAITSNGAVVDINVEEVQARQTRLERENRDLQDKVEALRDNLRQVQEKYRLVRLYLRLPPDEVFRGTSQLQNELATLENRQPR